MYILAPHQERMRSRVAAYILREDGSDMQAEDLDGSRLRELFPAHTLTMERHEGRVRAVATPRR